MSEKEIRRILREVCAQLDRQARRAVLPAVIGVGLAFGGCGEDIEPPAKDSQGSPKDAGIDAVLVRDAGIDGVLPRDAAIYSAPDLVYGVRSPDSAARDKGKVLDAIIPPDHPVYFAPDTKKTD